MAIARALANEPAIILGDKPTGDINQATGRKVIRLIQDLNETLNQTVIIVTHDPAVAKASKHTLFMLDGRIEQNPPKIVAETQGVVLTEERRQLFLAELGWLKTSLLRLEERKNEIGFKAYNQGVLGYKT